MKGNKSENFWQKLERPIIALGPLYDVTDAAFRRIIAKYSKADIMFTEFASADGLVHPIGGPKVRELLRYSEEERPIVAQLFTSRPEKMRQAAALCAELGFDGVDINMGCPDKTIEKQGAGAALLKNLPLAKELIKAAQTGAPALPISVKTRIGYNQMEIEEIIPALLAARPAALTLHLRTRKEMSKALARWELMPRIMELAKGSGTIILGNGDVATPAEALEKVAQYGGDGAMIGRGIFGNPWLFNLEAGPPSAKERLEALIEHIELFDQLHGERKNFAVMKKHFKAYLPAEALAKEGLVGFDGAHNLRDELMAAPTATEAVAIIKRFLNQSDLL